MATLFQLIYDNFSLILLLNNTITSEQLAASNGNIISYSLPFLGEARTRLTLCVIHTS